MIMEFLEYLLVMGLSSSKVLLGVASAVGFDMDFSEIFLTVGVGGILGIALYATLGKEIRDWFLRRRRAKGIPVKNLTAARIKKLRMLIRIWKRFGIVGIAFLTPPLLTPPVGTAIALAFGERVSKIVLYFGASMVAWSLIFALFSSQISNLIH